MLPSGLRRAWSDPLIRFLLVAGTLYLAWYVLYQGILHPQGGLDKAVINNLMTLSGGTLETLGFELLPETHPGSERYIGVQGGSQLWIGDPCNGVSLFAVFTVFLIAYAGPWKHKLWFLPLGLLSIHLINVVRIVVLCYVITIDYELLNFNHDLVFYVVVYSWIFGLWYVWVKYFASRGRSAGVVP